MHDVLKRGESKNNSDGSQKKRLIQKFLNLKNVFICKLIY